MSKIPKPRTDRQGNPLTATPCASCGKPLDAAQGAGHHVRPSPGDVTVCVYCREVLTFDKYMILRPSTLAEIMDLPPEQRAMIGRVQRACRFFKP